MAQLLRQRVRPSGPEASMLPRPPYTHPPPSRSMMNDDGLCSLRLRQGCEWEGVYYHAVTTVESVPVLSGGRWAGPSQGSHPSLTPRRSVSGGPLRAGAAGPLRLQHIAALSPAWLGGLG